MRQILRNSKHPGMKGGQLGVDKEGGAGEGGAGEGGAGEGGAVETVILFPSETALTVEEYRTKSPSFLSDNNDSGDDKGGDDEGGDDKGGDDKGGDDKGGDDKGGDDKGGDDKGGDHEGVGRTAAENGVGVTNIIVFDGTWSNVR
jgi:hypothetical protein